MGIMSNGMWGVGFSIVQARMRKLLKRMVASPMRKSEYLLAQLLARLIFLAPEVAVPIVFGVLAFGMPVNGSVGAIAVVTLIGVAGIRGARVADRQPGADVRGRLRPDEHRHAADVAPERRVLLLVELSCRPSSRSIQALPLTALVDALRAVVLEGATLHAVRAELLGLTLWTVLPFGIALRIFKWR